MINYNEVTEEVIYPDGEEQRITVNAVDVLGIPLVVYFTHDTIDGYMDFNIASPSLKVLVISYRYPDSYLNLTEQAVTQESYNQFVVNLLNTKFVPLIQSHGVEVIKEMITNGEKEWDSNMIR